MEVPYGTIYQTVNVKSDSLLGMLTPPRVEAPTDQGAVIENALRNPIGQRFPEFSPEMNVAIVVDDVTRVTPTKALLEPVLGKLRQAGISRDRITIFVANGLHSLGDSDTLAKLLGERIIKDYKIVNHDGHDQSALHHLGETKRGTPVEVNRAVLQHAIRILTGLVEPHQLAGYSGGVKAMIPGLAGERTITANHSLMMQSGVQAGNLEANPLRDDLEEATKLTHSSGVNFIVDVVLNSDNKIVDVVAGDEIKAHRRGAEISRKTSSVTSPEPADLVITSPGGYPRDLNLYQSQKALAHVEPVVRKGGVTILVAECRYGSGSKTCEEWMSKASSPTEVIRRIKEEGFSMGAHKAYQLARFMSKTDVIFVTSMSSRLTETMHLRTAPDLKSAYSEALDMIGSDATVLVCPQAASVLPVLQDDDQ